MSSKTAVLLMAYGAAARPEDVPAYLEDIRGGRPPSPELVAEIQERYRLMGGRSPLLDITRAQAKALEVKLCEADPSEEYKVYVGMRHSAPTIADAVREMKADGQSWVVALALTPYYSKLSVGAYMARYHEAIVDAEARFTTLEVESWSCHPLYVQAWAEKVLAALSRFTAKERAGVRVLFTAHSLPARILNDGDPYPTELQRTTAAVARAAGLEAWDFAYQSAGRTPEPWLGPEAAQVIDRLAERKHSGVLLVPIGFISDHMETLYDDDILYKQRAEALGLRFERAESLNDDPRLIGALADVVLKRLVTQEG